MLRAVAFLSSLVLVAAVALATTASADRAAPAAVAAARRIRPNAPTTIRLDGIGPVRVGMKLRAVEATGWIRSTAETCFGGSVPLPTVSHSDGPRAAPGVSFGAYFRGRGANSTLTNIMFASGARTELGIRPGVSTAAQMVARYRRAGFTVRTTYLREYGGTFVDVVRRGKVVMTGFAQGRLGDRRALGVLAIPRFFRC